MFGCADGDCLPDAAGGTGDQNDTSSEWKVRISHAAQLIGACCPPGHRLAVGELGELGQAWGLVLGLFW